MNIYYEENIAGKGMCNFHHDIIIIPFLSLDIGCSSVRLLFWKASTGSARHIAVGLTLAPAAAVVGGEAHWGQ